MPTCMTEATILDRKVLLQALNRVARVIPRATVKPVLACVYLMAEHNRLHLSATDGDVSITTQIDAEGHAPQLSWGDALFESEGEAELIEAVRDGWLWLCDEEAIGGEFEDIESACRELGLSYIRFSEEY